jgi:hypothetical protein
VIPVPVSTPPAVAPAPDLYSVRVRGSLARKRGKLRVRFSLTRSEHVRFRVYRRGSRHALASWTVRGRAGRNSVTVKRRLPTRRTLKRGRYTLKVGLGSTVTASQAVRIR